MKVLKQRKAKTSRISRRSAMPVLFLIACFVFIFHTWNPHHSFALQTLDVSACLITQGRLPNSNLYGTHAPRLETSSSRAMHWAMNSAIDVPVSLFSLSHRIESVRERHVLSLLADSGLEVRAPPQPFFSNNL